MTTTENTLKKGSIGQRSALFSNERWNELMKQIWPMRYNSNWLSTLSNDKVFRAFRDNDYATYVSLFDWLFQKVFRFEAKSTVAMDFQSLADKIDPLDLYRFYLAHNDIVLHVSSSATPSFDNGTRGTVTSIIPGAMATNCMSFWFHFGRKAEEKAYELEIMKAYGNMQHIISLAKFLGREFLIAKLRLSIDVRSLMSVNKTASATKPGKQQKQRIDTIEVYVRLQLLKFEDGDGLKIDANGIDEDLEKQLSAAIHNSMNEQNVAQDSAAQSTKPTSVGKGTAMLQAVYRDEAFQRISKEQAEAAGVDLELSNTYAETVVGRFDTPFGKVVGSSDIQRRHYDRDLSICVYLSAEHVATRWKLSAAMDDLPNNLPASGYLSDDTESITNGNKYVWEPNFEMDEIEGASQVYPYSNKSYILDLELIASKKSATNIGGVKGASFVPTTQEEILDKVNERLGQNTSFSDELKKLEKANMLEDAPFQDSNELQVDCVSMLRSDNGTVHTRFYRNDRKTREQLNTLLFMDTTIEVALQGPLESGGAWDTYNNTLICVQHWLYEDPSEMSDITPEQLKLYKSELDSLWSMRKRPRYLHLRVPLAPDQPLSKLIQQIKQLDAKKKERSIASRLYDHSGSFGHLFYMARVNVDMSEIESYMNTNGGAKAKSSIPNNLRSNSPSSETMNRFSAFSSDTLNRMINILYGSADAASRVAKIVHMKGEKKKKSKSENSSNSKLQRDVVWMGLYLPDQLASDEVIWPRIQISRGTDNKGVQIGEPAPTTFITDPLAEILKNVESASNGKICDNCGMIKEIAQCKYLVPQKGESRFQIKICACSDSCYKKLERIYNDA